MKRKLQAIYNKKHPLVKLSDLGKEKLEKESDEESDSESDKEEDMESCSDDEPSRLEADDKTFLMFFYLWPIDCVHFMSSFCYFRLFNDNYNFLE